MNRSPLPRIVNTINLAVLGHEILQYFIKLMTTKIRRNKEAPSRQRLKDLLRDVHGVYQKQTLISFLTVNPENSIIIIIIYSQ